jgi:hypothetical protein
LWRAEAAAVPGDGEPTRAHVETAARRAGEPMGVEAVRASQWEDRQRGQAKASLYSLRFPHMMLRLTMEGMPAPTQQGAHPKRRGLAYCRAAHCSAARCSAARCARTMRHGCLQARQGAAGACHNPEHQPIMHPSDCAAALAPPSAQGVGTPTPSNTQPAQHAHGPTTHPTSPRHHPSTWQVALDKAEVVGALVLAQQKLPHLLHGVHREEAGPSAHGNARGKAEGSLARPERPGEMQSMLSHRRVRSWQQWRTGPPAWAAPIHKAMPPIPPFPAPGHAAGGLEGLPPRTFPPPPSGAAAATPPAPRRPPPPQATAPCPPAAPPPLPLR